MPSSSFNQPGIDPKTALETLCRLAPYGFGESEFELVHHWREKGKLTGFVRHCRKLISRKGLFRPDDNNHLLHLRLLWMLKRCSELPPSDRKFEALAKKALEEHRPIKKGTK